MMDANGKKHRQFKYNLRSRKFANVQVLTLSRRKQGFESPRERQRQPSHPYSASAVLICRLVRVAATGYCPFSSL
jgi:hypothetical protein